MIDPAAARALANRIDYALGHPRRDTTITLNPAQARLAAEALRAAAEGQTVPKGWKIVPRDPTAEMIDAGVDVWTRSRFSIVTQYRTMIDIAPEWTGAKGGDG